MLNQYKCYFASLVLIITGCGGGGGNSSDSGSSTANTGTPTLSSHVVASDFYAGMTSLAMCSGACFQSNTSSTQKSGYLRSMTTSPLTRSEELSADSVTNINTFITATPLDKKGNLRVKVSHRNFDSAGKPDGTVTVANMFVTLADLKTNFSIVFADKSSIKLNSLSDRASLSAASGNFTSINDKLVQDHFNPKTKDLVLNYFFDAGSLMDDKTSEKIAEEYGVFQLDFTKSTFNVCYVTLPDKPDANIPPDEKLLYLSYPILNIVMKNGKPIKINGVNTLQDRSSISVLTLGDSPSLNTTGFNSDGYLETLLDEGEGVLKSIDNKTLPQFSNDKNIFQACQEKWDISAPFGKTLNKQYADGENKLKLILAGEFKDKTKFKDTTSSAVVSGFNSGILQKVVYVVEEAPNKGTFKAMSSFIVNDTGNYQETEGGVIGTSGEFTSLSDFKISVTSLGFSRAPTFVSLAPNQSSYCTKIAPKLVLDGMTLSIKSIDSDIGQPTTATSCSFALYAEGTTKSFSLLFNRTFKDWCATGGDANKTIQDLLPSIQKQVGASSNSTALACKDITADMVNKITNLSIQTNDLSPLTGWIGLRNLIIGSPDLSSIPAGIFDNLIDLKLLYLSGNSSLSSLPEGIFDSLSSLNGLAFKNNKITTLPEGIFDNLSSLNGLAFMNNKITTLPQGIFDDLLNLSGLHLNESQLSSLPQNVFVKLTKLNTFSLSSKSSSLEVIKPLKNLQNLALVYLGNSETVFPDNLCANLKNLTIFTLSSINISSSCLAQLTKVENLTLDNIKFLDGLSDNTFQNIGNSLVDLAISRSQLNISENSFAGLTKLNSLGLFANDYTSSSSLSFNFKNLPQLSLLYIDDIGGEDNTGDSNVPVMTYSKYPTGFSHFDFTALTNLSVVRLFIDPANVNQQNLATQSPTVDSASFYLSSGADICSNAKMQTYLSKASDGIITDNDTHKPQGGFYSNIQICQNVIVPQQ